MLRHQGDAHKSTGKVLPENHIQERKEKNTEHVIKSIINCLKEKYRVFNQDLNEIKGVPSQGSNL